jgi:hypothetical protein
MNTLMVHNRIQIDTCWCGLRRPAGKAQMVRAIDSSGNTAAVSDAGQARTSRENTGCASARPTSKESQ